MTELDSWDEDNYKPRSYQEQLLACALKENVIIYLPTGSGKTFIALMAMREMSKTLTGTIAEGGKRSVFICNTIALARQQFDVIKNFTNLKCGVFTGDMDIDNWKRDKWENELDKFQVYVATCQIVVDVIRHKFIAVTDFNLMIFDECHHATGGHPMHQLMGQFQHYNQSELPRVIGLTGLLIKSSSKHKILKELQDLEAVFRAKIVTVANFDEFKNVLIYSTKANEVVLKYHDNKQKWKVTEHIEELVEECCNKIKNWKVDESHLKPTKNMGATRVASPIKKMRNLLQDFLYQLNDMGTYAGSIAIMAVLVEVELKKRSAETIIYRNMLRMIITYVERIRHLLVEKLYDSDDKDESECDVILQSSTPKLQQLLLYLKTTFEKKSSIDIKCLVFVERRHTAKVLYHVLKRFMQCDKSIPINPDFMVGASDSMPESVEYILDDKWNRNVLNNFRRNECNLIVASSVLEEGIDVQSCNYVIVFDEIKGFRSYVQTKGRARMEESYYNIMIPISKQSELINKITQYKEMDRILKDYLIGKTIDRTVPLIIETSRQFEEVIPPFETNIGARLEAENAVALLNRYCMGLPSDSFTNTGILYTKDAASGGGKYVVRLVLPLQSTIKEDILSDPMENIKWAKRSAAFKSCKLLYEKGEFSSHLLPITKKKCLELMTPIYFKHWNEFVEDIPRIAGTNKKRRLHNIEYPKKLWGSLPQTGIESYMHTIYVTPTFERNDENAHVYDTLSSPNNYAILTNKPLPKIAAIPLFMTQGSLTVQISPYGNSVLLTAEEITKLRNFHIMIFRDLLQITWARYFAQDHRNEPNSFLIVPTINQNEINWNLVKSFQNLSEVRKTSVIQRRKLVIREEDYLNNIVCSWYTADDKVRYIVRNIRKDLTPLSPFPTSLHESYAGYVYDKYGEQVVQNNSFMIEVQPLTSRANFLIGGKADGSRKKTKKFDSILLVPELCHNFRFPGDFWLKSRFLPSILHRLNFILIAEELRISFNTFLGIVQEDYNPLSLIVDQSLARVSSTEEVKRKDIIKLPSLISDSHPQPLTEKLSLVEANKYKWRHFEEPCDLTRYVEKLHKIEIDYYHQFITNKFGAITIDDAYESNQFDILQTKENQIDEVIKGPQVSAICDIPENERRNIEIFKISINSKIGPEQCDLLAAITTAGANDAFDMERVEVLGDSFLKFSISLFLLHSHPTWNEGYLSMVKGQLVSNRNLLYLAIKKKIPGAIKSRQFNAQSEWRPPIVSVPDNAIKCTNLDIISPSIFGELNLDEKEVTSGECNSESLASLKKSFDNFIIGPTYESDMCFLIDKIWISDKVCADVVEALLGVCVKSVGIQKSFSMLEYFGICSPGLDMKNLLNVNLGNPRVKTNITDKEIDAFLLNYQELERNLGYKFSDRAYLLQALTHPSYPTNRITGCYQQLEFVGDAILDFLITCYIFERCSFMDPGKLTDLRSALVNNVTLACIAVRHKFHLYLLYQNASLSQSIMKFYEFQKTQKFKVTDQVRVLILESESKYSMADYVDVPKTLGDVFEALIGAVFLDSGNDLVKTWNVIFHLIHEELFEFMNNVPIQVVRQLYEYNGAEPTFSEPVADDDVVMVSCSFTCRNEKRIVNGFGKNKSQAKISASKLALQHLLQA